LDCSILELDAGRNNVRIARDLDYFDDVFFYGCIKLGDIKLNPELSSSGGGIGSAKSFKRSLRRQLNPARPVGIPVSGIISTNTVTPFKMEIAIFAPRIVESKFVATKLVDPADRPS
jgi:hypothetical protein